MPDFVIKYLLCISVKNDGVIGNTFDLLRVLLHFNTKKVARVVEMETSFKYKWVSIATTEILFKTHLFNGKLFHDCYFDILGSNNKIIFFSPFISCDSSNRFVSSIDISHFRNLADVDPYLRKFEILPDSRKDCLSWLKHYYTFCLVI